MTTPATKLRNQIKAKLKDYPSLRLFSNPRGTMQSGKRFVCYGLAPGTKGLASSDLIGWKSIRITPEMVGKQIAQFVSVEIKAGKDELSTAQINWLMLVHASGGLPLVISEPEELSVIA